MATITFAWTIDGLKAKFPAAFGPIIDQMYPALGAMAADDFWAVVALAQSDPDAAQFILLEAMTNAQALARDENAAAALEAQEGPNADRVASQKQWLKEAWSAALIVLGSMATLAL